MPQQNLLIDLFGVDLGGSCLILSKAAQFLQILYFYFSFVKVKNVNIET